MALQFLGYVSEHSTREVGYSTLWKRTLSGEHIFIEFNDGESLEFHASPNGLDYPIEVFAVCPSTLHVVQSTVEEQNTFIWWVLFVSLLGIILVGIIATTAMYRVCQLQPSCSGGADCKI